jgi:hypothetical protein
MYVVTAAGQRQALPLPRPGRDRPGAPQAQPVGVRHAVATAVASDPFRVALCGADIREWLLFAGVTFDSGHAAACQRCAQLVSASNSSDQRARLAAVRSAGT